MTLIPSIITKPEYHRETMADLIGLYHNDRPNPDIVNQELLLWKNKMIFNFSWVTTFYTCRICKKYDDKRFSNVFVLLNIGCTLPVTSCECERRFSAMRRLRNWLRKSMKTDLLTSLALMNTHSDIAVDYDEVARLFLQLHPRKIYPKKLVFQ